jgi:hypothetical protein
MMTTTTMISTKVNPDGRRGLAGRVCMPLARQNKPRFVRAAMPEMAGHVTDFSFAGGRRPVSA